MIKRHGDERPLIELEAVWKVFRTATVQVTALQDVHLTIMTGTFLAIVGPSGSGKTTLLEILGCLSSISRGTYRFEGERVDQRNSDGLADLRNQAIGFVFQTFNLLPRLTAIQNVELPLTFQRTTRAERSRRAMEALERVGLAHRKDHPAPLLSGGERQRVAIARALVTRPRLILADEPTGNLDSQNGRAVLDLLTDARSGAQTVILVTHDPAIAKRADRVITIVDGLLREG